MVQLMGANHCADLPQRATLINLLDGGVGKREITNRSPVSLTVICAELLENASRLQLKLQWKQNMRSRLETSHILWFPLIIFHSLDVFTR